MRDRIEMINNRWTNHRDLHQKPSRSLRNYVIYMFVRVRLVLVDRYQGLSTAARNSYKRLYTSKTLQESKAVDRVNDSYYSFKKYLLYAAKRSIGFSLKIMYEHTIASLFYCYFCNDKIIGNIKHIKFSK